MRLWRGVAPLVAFAALGGAVGCGGGSSSGAVTLNWWAYNEPSGSFRKAAEQCTKDSGGKYRIAFNALGNNADSQRQSLVRRLSAKDASIDLMSMDVVWTGEFAEAKWIKPWPKRYADEVSKGTLEGPLKTATYQGRLYAAPANSNTQLLWYRKDLVPNPPKTWSEMIDQASKLKEAGRIEIQGAQYEGATVWFNSLVQSAGGDILSKPDQVGLPAGPTEQALGVMRDLARSKAADPSLANQKEDENRLAFETGKAAFQINYPFIYPSAKEGNPKVFKEIGWTTYPRVDADKPARPPIGGFNWGVGAYTKHADLAFQAATCLRDERSQRGYALDGGLPPTLSSIYDDGEFKKQYPFADVIRQSIADGAVRPTTPLYADVSLAVFKTVSPPSSIKDVKATAAKLRSRLKDALKSKGLL